MTPMQIVATIVGSVVGIIGLVFAVSKIMFEMIWKTKIDDLTAQNVKAEAKNKELLSEVTSLRQDREQKQLAASTAEEKKAEVDRRLQYTMEAMSAGGASIFVPEPSKLSTNFVFLSVFGPAAGNIHLMRVPINKGIVGSVYANGHTLNTSNAHNDPRWSNIMDEISKFRTQSLLCAPIMLGSVTIGVVQFLNKEGNRQFTSTDEELALKFATSIALTVDDFVHNPENFQRIGIAPERDEKEAIIAFLDLTASKSMFNFLPSSICVDRINEYLERQGEIAMKHGAVIDKYLGDGAMLRFMNSDVSNAISGCLAMRDDFEQMKDGWLKFDSRMSCVHSRIGLSYGLVREVNIGHPQFKQITVMGRVVNNASILCGCATRSRSIVLVDNMSYEEVAKEKIEMRPYVDSDLKGLAGAYEVIGHQLAV